MHLVKQEVNEAYLEMDAMNDLINDSINQALDEHKDVKFIGQPYDLDRKDSETEVTFSYKLDVYPEAKALNDNWKAVKVEAVDSEITSTELEDAMKGLRHQYATYVDAESATHHTVDRLKVIYMNADSEEIWTKTIFIEHADKHDGGFHNLEGKNIGDVIQVPYSQDVPAKLIYNKDEQIPSTITLEVLRTQKEELPDFTDESVLEMFGNEGITSLAVLEEKVKDVIKEQKYTNSIISNIDGFVEGVAPSFSVHIPGVMIESEYKNRYDAMCKRFGDKTKFEAAYTSLPNGKEELEKKQDELRVISKNSLTKFFILQKVCELLDIQNVERDKDMDIENKLYEHFNK
jgi:FKBP-type peptidyl-prolyl cis-trans isomerase (trigger factor)